MPKPARPGRAGHQFVILLDEYFDVNDGTHAAANPTGEPAERADVSASAVGGAGCSAADRGAASPVLGASLTQPFRWEIVPEPNPDCAVTSAFGEAPTRERAAEELRRALAGYAAGFGFLYEVTGHGAGRPAQVRELARVPIVPRDARPPAS